MSTVTFLQSLSTYHFYLVIVSERYNRSSKRKSAVYQRTKSQTKAYSMASLDVESQKRP